MKIKDFAEELKRSFQEFFGCDVYNKIEFNSGEFKVESMLIPKSSWEVSGLFELYSASIYIDNNNKPVVRGIDLSLIGESELLSKPLSLEDALVYIKEHLGTVKSKAIYDNF